jgi:hypothetical protein
MSGPNSPTDFYKVIARVLAANAPEGWAKASIRYRALSTVGEPETVYEMADGSRQAKAVRGADLRKAFMALRRLFYQPGKGTWFTAEFTLTQEGHFSTDFDFDNEPDWKIPAGAVAYARDLQDFPRDSEHTPEWLRSAVAGNS